MRDPFNETAFVTLDVCSGKRSPRVIDVLAFSFLPFEGTSARRRLLWGGATIKGATASEDVLLKVTVLTVPRGFH